MSSASGIPVYAMCLYLLTYIYPGDKSLERLMKNTMDFYNYTEVVPFDTE